MKMAQDRTSGGEPSKQRPRVYMEYFIDCPPCPREQRRRRDLQRKTPVQVGHGPPAVRRRRVRSSSTADEPISEGSAPSTPTTETDCPSFDDDSLLRPTEFQRRKSPFRRNKRPASATPTMSDFEPFQNVLKPRAVRADGRDGGTGAGGADDRVCSLQAMIRHRRTPSNNSNSSSNSSNLSVPDQHQHHYEQVN